MTKKLRLTVLGISLGVAFLAGCELIVDFDRTRIPADATDASVTPRDSATGDSAVDASDLDASDAATTDAADAATTDASDAAAADASDGSSDAADAGD